MNTIPTFYEELKTHFNHTWTIFLPAARHDWINLRIQDHKSIAEYNSEFFHSISIDPVGDDEQIEKTLSTLHSTNPVLSTQYQNMRFTKYSELIAHMLLAEKRQLFLLQNTKTQPPGTLPPQVQTETHFNAPQTTAQSSARGRGNQRGFPI